MECLLEKYEIPDSFFLRIIREQGSVMEDSFETQSKDVLIVNEVPSFQSGETHPRLKVVAISLSIKF